MGRAKECELYKLTITLIKLLKKKVRKKLHTEPVDKEITKNSGNWGSVATFFAVAET